MSSKEIKELRKAGKLDEALQMAKQALEVDPENIWNKRAIAWVYYDYMKKYTQPESFYGFKENLLKIKDLQLPEDEKMVFEKCAWQIGRIIFNLKKSEHIDYDKVNELFDIIKDLHFAKPSKEYTFVYKSFHKGHEKWSRYLEFADWWNFENFSSEDYLQEDYNNKKTMSIAEKAIIAYSKKLLEGESKAPSWAVVPKKNKTINKKKVGDYLPILENHIQNHPEYQYLPYYKAKLLLALGDKENILSSFLPFARQKRNDFWVWEVLAEIFPEEKEIQFSCYCKALNLSTPEDYLAKIRQTFATMLIERQMFDEAKTEIQIVINNRQKHNWKLSQQITQWTEQEWYASAAAKESNKDLYAQHVKVAEEILLQDVQEEIIVVEFINENKGVLNFIKDKQKFGFFKYSGFLIKPQIGDILKVRFNGDGRDGLYKILSVEKADQSLSSEVIRDYEGTLSVIPPHNFGFADDVFVEPKLIQKKGLTNGEVVSGKAILSFNKKKNEWGWKAIERE